MCIFFAVSGFSRNVEQNHRWCTIMHEHEKKKKEEKHNEKKNEKLYLLHKVWWICCFLFQALAMEQFPPFLSLSLWISDLILPTARWLNKAHRDYNKQTHSLKPVILYICRSLSLSCSFTFALNSAFSPNENLIRALTTTTTPNNIQKSHWMNSIFLPRCSFLFLVF